MAATQDMVIHLNRNPATSAEITRPSSARPAIPAYSPANTFRYTRHQDEFEQVMAYYWITEAQNTSTASASENTCGRSTTASGGADQPVGQDNSFATDQPESELRFGKGGVDDAEDAEVILHEYGHAIHFSHNFAFASEEAGATSEGFGDYWAVTGADVSPGRWASRNASRCHACRLGLDLLHQLGAALPATRSHQPALPGGS